MRPAYLTAWQDLAVRCVLCLVLITGVTANSALAQEVDDDPYLLRPGDVVLVKVLEDPALDTEALLLPDGRISLPMVGTVKAAGRTPQGLAGLISQRLRSNFVRPPNVTVSVSALAVDPEEEDEETELFEVFVLGEVSSPGRYEYEAEKPITVVKALSLAGGLGPFAASARIQVRERVEDAEVMRLFDYEAFEEGQISSPRDLGALVDGAIVVVPERGLFE
ncbi:MAG: polysaccharide biosynthesis/export family protein [Pseudomonadota bacterium]